MPLSRFPTSLAIRSIYHNAKFRIALRYAEKNIFDFSKNSYIINRLRRILTMEKKPRGGESRLKARFRLTRSQRILFSVARKAMEAAHGAVFGKDR